MQEPDLIVRRAPGKAERGALHCTSRLPSLATVRVRTHPTGRV